MVGKLQDLCGISQVIVMSWFLHHIEPKTYDRLTSSLWGMFTGIHRLIWFIKIKGMIKLTAKFCYDSFVTSFWNDMLVSLVEKWDFFFFREEFTCVVPPIPKGGGRLRDSGSASVLETWQPEGFPLSALRTLRGLSASIWHDVGRFCQNRGEYAVFVLVYMYFIGVKASAVRLLLRRGPEGVGRRAVQQQCDNIRLYMLLRHGTYCSKSSQICSWSRFPQRINIYPAYTFHM